MMIRNVDKRVDSFLTHPHARPPAASGTTDTSPRLFLLLGWSVGRSVGWLSVVIVVVAVVAFVVVLLACCVGTGTPVCETDGRCSLSLSLSRGTTIFRFHKP